MGTSSSDISSSQQQGAAKQNVEQAKEQAATEVQQAKEQAASKLKEQVNHKSTQVAEQTSSLTGDLRSVSEQLRKQGKDKPAQLIDKAAERSDQVANYLREADADRILSDLEDFGRRQPWVLAAGGLIVGLVASRFVKASSSQGSQQRQPYLAESVSEPVPPASYPDEATPRAGGNLSDPIGSDTGIAGVEDDLSDRSRRP